MNRVVRCVRLNRGFLKTPFEENSSTVKSYIVLPFSTHFRCISCFPGPHLEGNKFRDDRGLRTSVAPFTAASSLLQHTPIRLWPSVRNYAKKGKDKGGKAAKKVKLSQEDLVGVVDLEKVTKDLDRVLEDLKEKFIHQVTVRTSQGVFNNLMVKTPDGSFPLIQLAQVSQKNPQLVVVNLISAPQYIPNVKEAFASSGLNINPQQDGTSLFVPIPKVSREHREGLAKSAKQISEQSKKQLRETFSKYSKKIKAAKDGHSADSLRAADDMVKDLMHEKVKQVEEMTELKQKELMGGK